MALAVVVVAVAAAAAAAVWVCRGLEVAGVKVVGVAGDCIRQSVRVRCMCATRVCRGSAAKCVGTSAGLAPKHT